MPEVRAAPDVQPGRGDGDERLQLRGLRDPTGLAREPGLLHQAGWVSMLLLE